VHIGKYANINLGELDNEAKDKLVELWIPTLEGKKTTADDRRLKEALLAYREELLNVDPQDLEGDQPF
jgi:hypothetical protein